MMKKVFTILVAFWFVATAWGQSPEKLSYQAVIRNSSDQLVTNQNVGIQISILQGSASGMAVYAETHAPTTNGNGLVSIEVGEGSVVSGDFSAIDWANGSYFIKTETDPSGGVNYTITGVSPLLSVPYSLHSKTAESIAGGITEADPVFSAWDKSTGISITESQISDLGAYIETEADPSVPVGTQPGQMQYWDGTAWITVAAGNEGQMLSLVGGVPTWTTVVSLTDVVNPMTGKIWMDRNLGASRIAMSSTDTAAYGDLYQWGRGADGHESRTSGITATLSTSDTPGHGDFIKNGTYPHDWRNPKNDSLWQGVNGINNPCPGGYRLPTEAEWEAERLTWSSNDAAGAFNSLLKLTLPGGRFCETGALLTVGDYGFYWTSTVSGDFSKVLRFYSTQALMNDYYRGYGFTVRCIKE